LLNHGILLEAIPYVEKLKRNKLLPDNIQYCLATNGSLMTDDMIKLCKDYNVLVSVGIDGVDEKSNNFRVDKDGRNSSVHLLDLIKKLCAADLVVNASITITPYNLPYISNYTTVFKELGVKKIGFNFMRGRWIKENYEDSYEGFYSQCADQIIQNYLNSKDLDFEFQFQKKLNSLVQKQFFPLDCTCYGNQIVLFPDGTIGNCPFLKRSLGHVNEIGENWRIWETDVVKEWRKRLPINNEPDSGLPPSCLSGGGCAWNSFDLNGDIISPDIPLQVFTEKMLDFFLWPN